MISASNRNLVCEAIDDIAALSSLSDITVKFSDTAAKFGFDAFGISGLPPPADDTNPLVLTEIVPDGYRDFFIHERLYAICHTAVHARSACEPFRFSDAPSICGETRNRDRFLQIMESFRIGKGIIVPIGCCGSLPASIWLAGENPDLRDDTMLAMQVVSLFTASKVQALCRLRQSGAPASALTKREREVLQWISAGKTSWEISVISGQSERAINAVIADAMTKLNAVSRAQAVVNAIRQGEIEL